MRIRHKDFLEYAFYLQHERINRFGKIGDEIMDASLAIIFQSFWHFLGTIIIISVFGDILVGVIKALKGSREPECDDDFECECSECQHDIDLGKK